MTHYVYTLQVTTQVEVFPESLKEVITAWNEGTAMAEDLIGPGDTVQLVGDIVTVQSLFDESDF